MKDDKETGGTRGPLARGLEDQPKEIHDLENTKMLLQTENVRLKRELDHLTHELEGMDITESSSATLMNLYKNRQEKCVDNTKKLQARKESLVEQINTLNLSIKAALEDTESSLSLRDSMERELDEIKDAKSVMLKRFTDVKSGLQRISTDKNVKLPHLNLYDKILKQVHNIVVEAKNRMEVSTLMKSK